MGYVMVLLQHLPVHTRTTRKETQDSQHRQKIDMRCNSTEPTFYIPNQIIYSKFTQKGVVAPFLKHHTMKAYKGTCSKVPYIVDLNTRWS